MLCVVRSESWRQLVAGSAHREPSYSIVLDKNSSCGYIATKLVI